MLDIFSYFCMDPCTARGTVVVESLSHVQLFGTTWTVVHQVPLSLGFLRQDYWSGLPFPSPGDDPRD